jgi:hypothetical protein
MWLASHSNASGQHHKRTLKDFHGHCQAFHIISIAVFQLVNLTDNYVGDIQKLRFTFTDSEGLQLVIFQMQHQ